MVSWKSAHRILAEAPHRGEACRARMFKLRLVSMIPFFDVETDEGRAGIEKLLARLRLDPVDLALSRGQLASAVESVRAILADIARRGDDALVEISRRFDDPA